MPASILVYGANGYTGQLVAREARARGVEVILAGRNGPEVQAIADELGFEARIFGLDVPSTIDACLEGISVVAHCAGPFSRTATPMIDACMRTRVHYLDVTGELEVFEAARARDDEARTAGITLLPGGGFDVVPSDCLAMHVAKRIAHPTSLRLGILVLGQTSHGTATTMAENLPRGSAIRKDGKLVKIPAGTRTRQIDFGRGPRLSMIIPWGDLATAWHSTRIPNIEVYFAVTRGVHVGARVVGLMPWLFANAPVQKMIKRAIDRRPAGPDAAARATGLSVLTAEVENAAGERAVSRLETPEGYTLTSQAVVTLATRMARGEAPIGYQTPGTAFGPDFVLSLPGTRRTDL